MKAKSPAKKSPAKKSPAKKAHSPSATGSPEQVAWVLAWLKAHSTRATLLGMSRYAIPSEHALGVAMKDVKALGKLLGQNHALALALWDTGCYEARLLISFIADPAQLSAVHMDSWCKDFDNWAICDTLCFNLFDRTPHAWAKVTEWSREPGEFQKRTAFALLWSLALHDKQASDAQFLNGLKLIEAAALDPRNFVKKAVAMALGAIGRRASLRAACIALATRLGAHADPTARWLGKTTLGALG